MGIDIGSVERNLTRILQTSTAWNAILLLDEADVFLEQRSSHDLERNGLISGKIPVSQTGAAGDNAFLSLSKLVFLRVLEYFEGILFLTTNRVSSLDKAVKSRIHLAVHFPPLSFESRRQLWTMFLKLAAESSVKWCEDKIVDELANWELNGRQIKNVVRTAQMLAIRGKQDLKYSHVQTSLKSLTQFEENVELAIQSPQEPEVHRKRRRLD